jgi:hypothetical protein
VKRSTLGGILGIMLLFAIPLAASANDCVNLSRKPGNVSDQQGLVTKGNWLYLPSICGIFDPCTEGTPPPLWLFLPPGAGFSGILDNGSFHGNYTNGVTDHLLGMSAICTKVPYQTNDPRQTDHGIQNDCVAPPA